MTAFRITWILSWCVCVCVFWCGYILKISYLCTKTNMCTQTGIHYYNTSFLQKNASYKDTLAHFSQPQTKQYHNCNWIIPTQDKINRYMTFQAKKACGWGKGRGRGDKRGDGREAKIQKEILEFNIITLTCTLPTCICVHTHTHTLNAL